MVGRDKDIMIADLIVNADDYGYSEGVSLGILDAARYGIVTATGVLANGPFFDEHADWLRSTSTLDTGVHLNLTFGKPLTRQYADLLGGPDKIFPISVTFVVQMILLGKIPVEIIEKEWDAQIQRCRDAGLTIWFLNSHEHLHAFPPLFRLVHRLADRHGIPYVRYPSAEWFGFQSLGGLLRETVLQMCDWGIRVGGRREEPVLIGITHSGRLNLSYLQRRLASLRPGRVYELMCHPGYCDSRLKEDHRLLSYHNWDEEVESLCSAEAKTICHSMGIRLVGYRDLSHILPRNRSSGV
jgi:chitin disaccharide deacetylase